MKVKEIISLVEHDGWELARTTGDHRIYKKNGVAASLVIPGKPSDDMPIGTQQAILRKAGLKNNVK